MGLKKYRSTVKKQFHRSLVEYTKQLEAELQEVYNNPDTMAGKFAAAYQQSQSSNKRLSVLCATLLKQHPGNRATLSKADMESFKGKVINIRWELPDGIEKPDDAKEYVFTYDAITEEEFAKQQRKAAMAPGAPAPAEPQPPVSGAPEGTVTETATATPSVPVPIGPGGYDPSQEIISPEAGPPPMPAGTQESVPAIPDTA
jgi:hypothetical protein